MGRTVTVRVPATSANLGSGFDSLGIALNLTADVRVTLRNSPAPYPRNRAEHIALAAARGVFVQTGQVPPVHLQVEYHGNIPVGRGLGASAVLRAGAVLASNRLLGDPLSLDQALVIASELEGHADNVAPAIFGGFQVVVWDQGRLTRVAVPLPTDLRAVLFVPELDMPTGESRKLLPSEVSRHDAIFNLGRSALVVAALATGRLDALRVATQDVLHQPARAQLFPALFDIIDAAVAAGASCAYLSGGGSTILALTVENAEAIGAAMNGAAAGRGTGGTVILTTPRACGAEIIVDEASS